ncbi:gonadal protein gdl-ORF39 [Drosophila subpulchrella]|nr:gonadal protein gdl-ORF39 [Drosophila subpulchrella]XP_037721522.1 gonadal protein gdl-ORF39 [Drosophila subpulchrella]XP_037721523.1 gonadal protein gdl-ORF39 [Drosophila subpulchrella]
MWATNVIVVTLMLLHLATLAISCSCGEGASFECGCTKQVGAPL